MSTRRSLARPRPSILNGINSASSPNLGAVYSSQKQHSGASPGSSARPHALLQKQSLNALTSTTLSSIPDESLGYSLNTSLDDQSEAARMPPFTPSRAGGGEDLEVGDLVDVPGSMYGTVKFIGTVQGKKGTFAGVELSEEFAGRGKNNGDVDGISYFKTMIAGAGIFLPINRALRRGSPSSQEGSFPLTPTTPSIGGNFKIAGQGSRAFTPPTPSLPKFSQSVGPGRAASPQIKKSRPSLPRPESPLRKPQLSSRPSIGTPTSKAPTRYGSPAPGKFGQSVRGTQDSRDPSKKAGHTPKNALKASVGPRSASALGQAPMNYSADELTPVGINRAATNGSLGSVSLFNTKMRPASRSASRANNDDEVNRLRGQLEERDKQLKEQASSLAEMENSLVEVQALMNSPEVGSRQNRGSMEGKDSAQLRAMLREKNEKIAMLTAEFDAHRADFRSTIDTLELASTETERVYEKRVEDLMQEVKEFAERGEDVDSVARQLKQLEELVQELEEGLEDARRGEAEARGEVEFLRGEVERTRSELRREREKAAAAMNVGSANGETGSLSKELEQRDDEIRGLKAIIHSLSRDAIPDTGISNGDTQKTPTHRHSASRRKASNGGIDSIDDRLAREKLEREVAELRATIETRINREDELEREVERLRRGSISNGTNQRASAISTATVTPDTPSIRDSKGTVVSWRDRDSRASPESHRRGNTLETMPESDTYSSTNESFCELCETSGHDILTCTNMFSPNNSAPRENNHLLHGKDVVKAGLSPKPSHDEYKPAPLSPLKNKSSYSSLQKPSPPVRIMPNPMESGPVAGKESGVVNMDKWCGVCEREGHDSIDCPFEDAF
ncbi:related to Tip elongation protein 1 [Rhynchosporium secalis]|uniref:Related to Tip elongation protein 1 n=1 Tax=Rhynchosporium secalis TaxID=38038 RepID=A0A1E1MED7_RHYSE|nr:related to Tip elongation protein 1 [Rhynchosporium secalis]